MIRKIFNRLRLLYAKSSSERYIAYLRSKGIQIGDGTHIDADSCTIDITRPSLVTIGKNCFINRNFTLLTHDWTSFVFINSRRNFVNCSGRVVIGNNVSFGQNVFVLKGVEIGDNCFIGAGSIVTKNIPSNSIAVGAPCRVIMSLEDYYQRRLMQSEVEALEYAKSITERFHRVPTPSDFWEEFVWFVDGNKIDMFPEIPIKKQLGASYEDYKAHHKAKYSSFNEFLKAAGLRVD